MNESTLKIPIIKTDHTKGPRSAPVNIVEYSDFQCPYCAAASPILETLIENFRHTLCFAYRHFPITTLHPHAAKAAVASEAAALQSQFWSMHDALFSNQAYISDNSILIMARELKLDMKKFERDLERPELIEKVQADFNSGVKSGVSGTPTLFINGLRYEGEINYEDLAREVEQIIDENRASL